MDNSILNLDNCLSSSLFSVPPVSQLAASLLVLLSTSSDPIEAIITNLSLEPTWRWYWVMTPFETVFLFLIIAQFCILNMLGIMPLNVSDLVNGLPSGRKKRETSKVSSIKSDLGTRLLSLLRKLDQSECSLRTLCELENQSTKGIKIPKQTKVMLSLLKRSAKKRKSQPYIIGRDDLDATSKEIIPFEKAIETGSFSAPFTNSTLCQEKYSICPISTQEIMDYVEKIRLDELLL